MTLAECYATMGADLETIKQRLPKESLIQKLLLMFPKDQSYEQLKAGLEAEDYDVAFRAAHTLKGVALNLGLTPLATSAAVLTDALRSGAPTQDPEPLFRQVTEDYQRAIHAIEQLDGE